MGYYTDSTEPSGCVFDASLSQGVGRVVWNKAVSGAGSHNSQPVCQNVPPPTKSPTASPTSSPTSSSTSATVIPSVAAAVNTAAAPLVSAVGDPHMQNILGQR